MSRYRRSMCGPGALLALIACGSQSSGDAVDAPVPGDAGSVDSAVDAAFDAPDAGCDPTAWHKENVTLGGTDVSAIYGTAPDDVWMVTVVGRTFHRTAAGWTEAESFPNFRIPRAVWAADPQNVWVVGDRGVIVHRRVDGWDLERDPGDGIAELFGVHGVSTEDVWAVGSLAAGGPAVLHRVDGLWSEVPAPPSSGALRNVWAVGPDHIWVAADDGLFELDAGMWKNGASDDGYADVVLLPAGDLWALRNTFGSNAPLCHALAPGPGCVAFPGGFRVQGVDLAAVGDRVLAVASELTTLSTVVADLRAGQWTARTVAMGFPTAVFGVADQAWIGGTEALFRRGCD